MAVAEIKRQAALFDPDNRLLPDNDYSDTVFRKKPTAAALPAEPRP